MKSDNAICSEALKSSRTKGIGAPTGLGMSSGRKSTHETSRKR